MQIPTRKSQTLKKRDEESYDLTPEGLERLKRDIKNVEAQLPEVKEDLARAQLLGDFSENAEYQDAKFKLRKLNDRLFFMKDRLMRVRVIEKSGADRVSRWR